MATNNAQEDRSQQFRDSEWRAFTHHRGPVTCVAGVPHTRLAVSSGYDSAVGIIDLEHHSVELLGYHRHLVNRVVVNAQGTVAATCSSDYTVCLWDLEQGVPLKVLRGHWDDVEDFAFIGDSTGVSVSRDRRILIWNLENGSIEGILEGHDRDVLSVEYADGRLYTSGDDMTLRQWDLNSGRQLQVWGPFEVETDTCAIDPIHRRAVLGADDGSIRIFDIESGEPVGHIAAHDSGIKKVAVSPGTGDILSAAYDQKILIWDATSLERKRAIERHPATWERSLNWSPDGELVLGGTFDGTVLAWEESTGRLLDEIGARANSPGNACLNDVSCDDSGLCAVVSDDGVVRLAQAAPENPVWMDQATPGKRRILMNSVCLSPGPGNDRKPLIWCGAHDHSIHILDAVNGAVRPRYSLNLNAGPINCIRTLSNSPDCVTAFAACYSGAVVKIALRDQAGPEIESRMKLHPGAVKSLRIRPGEQHAASGAADGTLVTWALDGQIRHRLAGHTAIVDDVDFDPTGEFLASVSRDFTVNVYAFESGRLLHSILLGRESPKCVLFWNEKIIFVGNYWGGIWRVSLADERVTCHQVAINGVSSMSRSGDGLIAASYDGSLCLLDPDSMQVKSRLQCLQQKLSGFQYAASFE